MKITHRIRINVTNAAGNRASVMEGGICTLPKRLVRALFGEATQILVLAPGQSIDSVEVHEVKEGGNSLEVVRS